MSDHTSVFLERKYGVKLEELSSIEEITQIVEERNEKKASPDSKKTWSY